jgi:hypothetical protein
MKTSDSWRVSQSVQEIIILCAEVTIIVKRNIPWQKLLAEGGGHSQLTEEIERDEVLILPQRTMHLKCPKYWGNIVA